MDRIHLYLYNNLHAGDVLFSRPLYRAIIESGLFEVVLAGFRNNAYLLEDLVGRNARLHVSEYLEKGPRVMFDLGVDCPPNHLAISTWLGEFEDTGSHQWGSVVEVFNRQAEAHGIDFRVLYRADAIPMVDFAPRTISVDVTAPSVYVDNCEVRSPHSQFVFDLAELAAMFPAVSFLCVSRPVGDSARNIVDASTYDLRDLSAISNQCLAILGKGSGPFCCTYTEPNRFKPRAVCGYHSETSPTFWDYPGSPIQHLDTMAEVVQFVAAAVGSEGARQAGQPRLEVTEA